MKEKHDWLLVSILGLWFYATTYIHFVIIRPAIQFQPLLAQWCANLLMCAIVFGIPALAVYKDRQG